MLFEVVVHTDEVEGRRNENCGVCALHCRFQHNWQNLRGEMMEPLFGFIFRAHTVKTNEILVNTLRNVDRGPSFLSSNFSSNVPEGRV